MNVNTNTNKPVVSAYKQLSGILEDVATGGITINDAMNKIQLKNAQPTKPYCKVTSSGALALYGIKKEPIVMYADQWTKLLKVTKSPYIENYMKYNKNKLKYKVKRQYSPSSQSLKSMSQDNLISENDVDNV